MSRGPLGRSLLVAVGLFVAPALSHGQARASLPYDLAAPPGRIRTFARLLLSKDEATAREAEIRLACAGPRALSALDDAGIASRPEAAKRIRWVIDHGLRTSMSEADLRRHPRLFALVGDRIRGAIRLADSLGGRHKVGNFTVGGQGVGWDLDGDRRLAAFGGFAVPAALHLLRDPRAMARIVAIQTLELTQASFGAESLRTLSGDGARFGVWHGDCGSEETVGSYASGVANSVGQMGFESTVGGHIPESADVLNGIRQVSWALAESTGGSSLEARTWDEWWDRARPAWRDWWSLSAGGEHPPDGEAWWNSVSAYEGFQLYRSFAYDGLTRLDLEGPPGTRVEVAASEWAPGDSIILVRGSTPVRVEVPRDSAKVLGWDVPEAEMVQPPGTTWVRAEFPSGRRWEKEFVSFAGSRWRIVLLDPPRRPKALGPSARASRATVGAH